MLRLLLFSSALVAVQDPAPPPADIDKPAAKVESEAAEASALADYNATRGKTPDTAAGHWKLALWCEQRGLKPEAYVHLGRLIELEPGRDAAWQKLGFKKHDGRWMTPDQIKADDEQKKAEKDWLVRLRKWHMEIHGGKKQAEALAALNGVTSPSSVSSVYREFGGGGARDQEIAVQLLGQIESPLASKTLAVMAVYGRSPNVRRLATETLRGRKPEEYLDVLVRLMKDLLKYEVRPVGGPGSPGVLFVEGERFNVQRFYAPPPPPNISPRPGDMISYDTLGLPVITRSVGVIGTILAPGLKGKSLEFDQAIQYSYSQMMIETQKGTSAAQSQLAGDVARIDAINAERDRFNQLVMNAAKDASGKNPGKAAKDWRALIAEKDARYQPRPQTRRIPTIEELVPPAYVPMFAQATFLVRPVVDH